MGDTNIRRQITVNREVWKSIQDRAKLFGRTVGEYLSWLHAVQSKVVPLDEPDLPGLKETKVFVEPVIREDRDLTEDERSDVDGTSPSEIVPIPTPDARQESDVKSKSVVKRMAIQNPSSGTVDWRDEKKSQSKSVSIDPGGTGKKTKMR